MTEAEWLSATDPRPMLNFLCGKASDRKLRLFATACCRRIWNLLPDERCRSAVETAERFADGLASVESLKEARREATLAYDEYPDHEETGRFTGRESAAAAAAGACWTDDDEFWNLGLPDVVDNGYGLGPLSTGWRNGGRIEFLRQCRDLREIFGNPFRAVILSPSWLTNDEIAMAQAIYDARAFDRLPELADILRRLGCEDAAVLAHCGERGPHVRGCWVVDVVLGKG